MTVVHLAKDSSACKSTYETAHIHNKHGKTRETLFAQMIHLKCKHVDNRSDIIHFVASVYNV